MRIFLVFRFGVKCFFHSPEYFFSGFLGRKMPQAFVRGKFNIGT
jgi:hypothetical protein